MGKGGSVPVAADLGPVPEPEALVALGRIQSPAKLGGLVTGWIGLPSPGSAELTEMLTSIEEANIVDPNASIDAAATFALDGMRVRPRVAVSGGVRSLDEARRAFGRAGHVEDRPGGVVRWAAPARGDEDPERFCEVTPGVAGGGGRIVCADTESTLDEIGPYLARTLPRKSFAAPIHGEVRTKPVGVPLKRMRSMFPSLMRSVLSSKGAGPKMMALLEGVGGELIDFVSDLDRIELDIRTADSGVEGVLSAVFIDKQAMATQIVLAPVHEPPGPPDHFYHLPSDTDVAWYHRGADSSQIKKPIDLLTGGIEEQLEAAGVDAGDRKLVVATIGGYLELASGPVVFGRGVDTIDAQAALSEAAANPSSKPGPKRDKALEHARKALAGWNLIGFEAPPAKVQDLVRKLGQLASRAPKIRAKTGKGDPNVSFSLNQAPLARALGLPAGSVAYQIRAKSKSKDAKVPSEQVVLLVVPEGARTWLGLGLDVRALARKAHDATGGAEKDTLAGRTGLELLRSEGTVSGGFVTVRGLAGAEAADWLFDSPHSVKNPYRGMIRAPGQGTTPIVFAKGVKREPGVAGRLEMRLVIPREALKDGAQVAMMRPQRL